MRIVMFASGEFAIPTLLSLTDPQHDKHEVVAVVTQPDRPSGRGQSAKPTPVKAAALELGLDVIATEDVNAPEIVERLQACGADLGLAIAFGQKIGKGVRELFRHECVNLHASLLPKYRGAAPFQWALINGEERTGVTVFRLVDRMDAGPVYVHRWTLIKPDETASQLHDRLSRIGVDAVTATLDILANDANFVPAEQDESQATRAPKLKKEDGYLRFDRPAAELARRVCGLWDWPGAKCRFHSAKTGRSERVTLALARIGDAGTAAEEPGTVDIRRYVATGKGYLEILEIKPDGARLMAFHDFVNGRHVEPGDRFTTITGDE
jgi:methionyl-tRNA formyltransferase